MDPLIALGTLVKDIALDKGKSKIGEALGKIFGPSSEKLMSGQISQLNIEQAVISEIAAHTRQEFLRLTAAVQTADEVEERFTAAQEHERPTPLDVANISAETLRQVGSSTTHQKRALLAAALVNSFDPKLYQIGVSQEVIEILENLSLPDVRTLEKSVTGINLSSDKNIDAFYLPSAIKLVELRLAHDSSSRPHISFYSNIVPTELGRILLAHLKGHTAW